MKKLVGVKELARMLEVKVGFIYKRTMAGCPNPIPHLKLGKLLRFDLEDSAFLAWLDGHRRGDAFC